MIVLVPLPLGPLCVLGVALALFGCGGDRPPPDQATSQEQIRRAVVEYSVLAAQGRGEAACEFVTNERRGMVDAAVVPGHMRDQLKDCASYWTWMGPRLPPDARGVMLGTQVRTVRITGEHATATTANGAVMDLRWSDGAWRLD